MSSVLLRKVKAYAVLTRPHKLLATVIMTLIGWLIVFIEAQNNIINPVYPVLTVVLAAAGGYVINDYFDAEVDAINKPYRPIPSGAVGRNEALVFSITLVLAAIVLALKSGPISFMFVTLNIALLYAYSYKLKELGFLGNVVVAFEGAASIIYGGLAASEPLGVLGLISRTLLPALYAFLLLLGREIVKTIEDYRADALRDVKSLPRVLGVRYAAIVASAILLSVAIISPLPMMLGFGIIYCVLAFITDVIIVYSIIILIHVRKENAEVTAARLRSLLKIAIFVGSLAFLLDLTVRALHLL